MSNKPEAWDWCPAAIGNVCPLGGGICNDANACFIQRLRQAGLTVIEAPPAKEPAA